MILGTTEVNSTLNTKSPIPENGVLNLVDEGDDNIRETFSLLRLGNILSDSLLFFCPISLYLL